MRAVFMFKARVLMTMALVLLVGGVLRSVAQATADVAKTGVQPPVFDVSTIKPSQVDDGSMSARWSETTYTAKNVSLESLLSGAYGIRTDLISGLPGWAKSANYDVVAKATEADPKVLKNLTREQRTAMMRRLVEERFQVKSHIEVKQLPVYHLVVAKGGIKFKQNEAKRGTEGCKGWTSSSGTNMKMQCVALETLTQNLAYRVQRSVIDKTGLPVSASYDMDLKWRKESDAALSDADMQLPTLFDALQEQLGLKLEPSKGPVETLVVDRIEKPSEN